jgi:hypothetical protein
MVPRNANPVVVFLKGYGGMLVGALALIGSVADTAWLGKPLGQLFLKGVQHQSSATLVVSDGLARLLAFLAAAFVISLGTAGWASYKSPRQMSELQKENRLQRKTLEGMRSAAKRIVHQAYPAAASPSYNFEKVHYRYSIGKDGTADVEATYHIRASGAPLHFWTFGIEAEVQAPPVHHLDEIQFQVQDKSPHDLAYLEEEDSGHSKRISVFFLPQIDPTETVPRQISFTYIWPQMLTKLLTEGNETLGWRISSHKEVVNVLFEVYFDPAIKDIECLQEGRVLPGYQPQVVTAGTGWKGWKYEVPKGPEDFPYELTFRRKSS